MDNSRGPFVGMREMALFAGAGGGILGGQLLGWHTVCGVELDPYCARVLVQRQNDGLLPPFPIWDNVETFDGRPWRGSVDVVSGGFPCQDLSVAGKGAGLKGKRSGLWFEMSRIIREMAPPVVFVENVPALVNRGLSVVLGELADMGYNAAWGVLGAHHVGAPHKRDRVWILAVPQRIRSQRKLQTRATPETISGGREVADTERVSIGSGFCPDKSRKERRGRSGHRATAVADTDGRGFQVGGEPEPRGEQGSCGDEPHGCREGRPGPPEISDSQGGGQPVRGGTQGQGRHPLWSDLQAKGQDLGLPWPIEPDVGRVAHGVAHRVDRLKTLGNGQVPRVAATAFRLLWDALSQQ